jgi:hypothetical protein
MPNSPAPLPAPIESNTYQFPASYRFTRFLLKNSQSVSPVCHFRPPRILPCNSHILPVHRRDSMRKWVIPAKPFALQRIYNRLHARSLPLLWNLHSVLLQ